MNSRANKLLAGSGALGFFLTAMLAYPSQAAQQRTLLALSKKDHTLAIVDPNTLKVVARAPVGADPHEVIASSDGKTAYVSNTGGGQFHVLNVIDLVAQKALPDFDTGALIGPHGLFFSGGKVWFTAEGAKVIARFDPASSKVDWIMGTGQNRTHMLYVCDNENQIYTTNVESATVTILELKDAPPPPPPSHNPQAGAFPPGGPGENRPGGPGGNHPGGPPSKRWHATVIEVGKGSEGFDVSADKRELWTANAQDGTISIIDLASKKVTATLDAKVFGANRLKFTPDGKQALISSLRSGDLVVYDVASRKEVKKVNIGHGGAGLLMDADGARAFIACTPDDYVAVVDLKTLEVTAHIDVGGNPDGLAWATIP